MKKILILLAAVTLLSWSARVSAQQIVNVELIAVPVDVGSQFQAVFKIDGLSANQAYEALVLGGLNGPDYPYQYDVSFYSDNNGEAIVSFIISNDINPLQTHYLSLKLYYDSQSSGWLVGEFGDDYTLHHLTGDEGTPLVTVTHSNPDDHHNMTVRTEIVTRSSYQFTWTSCSRNPDASNSYDEDYRGPLSIIIGDTASLETSWVGMESSEVKDVGVRIGCWDFPYNRVYMEEFQTSDPSIGIVGILPPVLNGSVTKLVGQIGYQGSLGYTDFELLNSEREDLSLDGWINRGNSAGSVSESHFNLPDGEYRYVLKYQNDIDIAISDTMRFSISTDLTGIDDIEQEVFVLIHSNPVVNKVLSIEVGSEGKLSIMDVSGKTVLQKKVSIGAKQIQVDLPSGMYLMDFLTEDKKRQREKIMVQ